MKILLALLLSFAAFSVTASPMKECMGETCPNPELTDFTGIFSLPIRIKLDGSVEFKWGTTTTEDTSNPQTSDTRGGDLRGPEITWYFSPVLAMSIEKNKVMVNLSEHSLNKAITLEGANTDAGYMVLENSGFEIGLGMGAFFDPVSIISFGVGILPGGGTMLYSERFAPNLEAAKNLPKLKFPKDAKSLDSWNDNDILMYTRKAGISFFASGSLYSVGAGLGFNAIGNWKVSLKKVSSGKIMATVSKISIQSLSMYTGMTLASVNVSLFGSQDKSFAYEFDLNNKMGQQGFDDFLKGNFKFTERMAKEGFVEGVTALTEAQTQAMGRILGVKVGFPFIGNLDFEKGMVKSFSKVHQLENDEKIENTMAVYSRSVETSGLAAKGMRNIALFAASHQQIVRKKSFKDEFVTANFKWLFSQKKTDIKDVKSRLLELKRMTGLWNTLEFNFPQEKQTYSQFEFDAMISSKGTEKLMAMDLIGSSPLMVQDKVEEFFQQENISSDTCRAFKRINTCKAHLIKTSTKALNKMAQKLGQMKVFHQNKNWKSFTETYAELGKEAITNQFTFQVFMEMVGKENFKMEFNISGEKLRAFHLDHFESDLAFQ